MNRLLWPRPAGCGEDSEVGDGGAGAPNGIDPIWVFDGEVPAELAARWSASGSDVVLFGDFCRVMACAAGLVLLLAGIATAVAGTAGPAAAELLLAAAVLALTRWWQRRASAAPGGFSAQEIGLIMSHYKQVQFDDWTTRDGRASVEAGVARQAQELARRLHGMSGWAAEPLAEQRLRSDLRREVTEIALAAREIHDRRAWLEAEQAAVQGPLSAPLARAMGDWQEQLDLAWTALAGRLAALTTYVDEVTVVAALAQQADLADRLRADLEHETDALMRQSAGHELAVANLTDLRAGLSGLRARLGAEPLASPQASRPEL